MASSFGASRSQPVSAGHAQPPASWAWFERICFLIKRKRLLANAEAALSDAFAARNGLHPNDPRRGAANELIKELRHRCVELELRRPPSAWRGAR